MDHVHVLLISGSTRAASSNTATLRTARAVAPDGVTARLFDGLAQLPAFNPDDDVDADDPGPLPPAVADLRKEIADVDAVLFCTPEYAGGLPGSFKNLLDWTVGGDGIYRKPAAWINVAAPGRGVNADAAMATVLGYVGADVVEEACVRLHVAHQGVGPDGLVADPGLRAGIAQVLVTVAERVWEIRRAAQQSPE